MVSAQPAPQPLSYAERAKKASRQSTSQAPINNPPPAPPHLPASLPLSPSPSSPPASPNPPAKPQQNTMPANGINGVLHDALSTSATTTTTTTSVTTASSSQPASKPPSPPRPTSAPNVWALRREQMVRSNPSATSPITAATSPPLTDPTSSPPSLLTPSFSNPALNKHNPLTTLAPRTGTSSASSSAASITATTHDLPPVAIAAAILRSPRLVLPEPPLLGDNPNSSAGTGTGSGNGNGNGNGSALPVPLMADETSWPEPSRSAKAASHSRERSRDSREKDKDREGDGDGASVPSTSGGTSGRRGEKTKWVPISPAELQAAADAVGRPSRGGGPRGGGSRGPRPSASGSGKTSAGPGSVMPSPAPRAAFLERPQEGGHGNQQHHHQQNQQQHPHPHQHQQPHQQQPPQPPRTNPHQPMQLPDRQQPPRMLPENMFVAPALIVPVPPPARRKKKASRPSPHAAGVRMPPHADNKQDVVFGMGAGAATPPPVAEPAGEAVKQRGRFGIGIAPPRPEGTEGEMSLGGLPPRRLEFGMPSGASSPDARGAIPLIGGANGGGGALGLGDMGMNMGMGMGGGLGGEGPQFNQHARRKSSAERFGDGGPGRFMGPPRGPSGRGRGGPGMNGPRGNGPYGSRGGYRGGPGGFNRLNDYVSPPHQLGPGPGLSAFSPPFDQHMALPAGDPSAAVAGGYPPPGAMPFPPMAPYGMMGAPYPPPPFFPPYGAPPGAQPFMGAPMAPPAPIPVPVTVIGFPLDPLRYYLLGQVEYYFSVNNLVNDVFLRNQMDAQGWVDISVIASFNRMRTLTHDSNLVRETMALSSLVEVMGDKVRLAHGHWEPFVLPAARTPRAAGMQVGAGGATEFESTSATPATSSETSAPSSLGDDEGDAKTSSEASATAAQP